MCTASALPVLAKSSALHKSIWIRWVDLIRKLERIESVVISRIIRVLFRSHGQITSDSKMCRLMEKMGIGLVELVGTSEELDH